MTKTLIDELGEWRRLRAMTSKKIVGEVEILFAHELDEILSRHAEPKEDKAVEPLAVLNALGKRAFETSKAHGWKHDNDGQAIALMHSELSEALEAMRKPDRKDEHLPHLNPVGLELADVLIRVFDFCGARGIDLATCVKEKMDYNDKRPMKHGGKVF